MAASNTHLTTKLGMVRLELAGMIRDGKHPPERVLMKSEQVKRLEDQLRGRGVPVSNWRPRA